MIIAEILFILASFFESNLQEDFTRVEKEMPNQQKKRKPSALFQMVSAFLIFLASDSEPIRGILLFVF
jgi:hypothetical protein